MKRVVCLGLVTMVLAACADAPSPPADRPAPDLFVAVQPGGPSGDAALYRGPLVVRDGCVLIGRPATGYSLPVWPSGTSAERDASGRVTILDADGNELAREGETVAMGGGFSAEFEPAAKVEPRDSQLHRVEAWLGYELPERCLGADVDGVWVVGEMVT